MKISLGIDFGSQYLTIYKKGEGVIFKEPSLLCVKKSDSNFIVLALGEDVKKIKDDDINQIIFSPLAEGTVKSVEYAALLLKYALNKIFKVLIFKNFEAHIAIPCGLNTEEAGKFVKVLKLAGLSKIHIVSAPLCVNSKPNLTTLVIDIGAGKADIAIIKSGEIVKGATLGIGGYNIDAMLLQKMTDKHSAYFAEFSARKAKEEIGSLFPNDTGSTQLVGIDINDNTPHNYPISSKLVHSQIEAVFKEIAKVAVSLVSILPENLQNELSEGGCILVGGSSLLTGAEKYFAKALGIPAFIPDNAENAIALGFKFIL